MEKTRQSTKKKVKDISGIGEMPHSIEAEQALLGCLILDPRIQLEVASSIKESDFFSEAHKCIFSAMSQLIAESRPIDLVTLTDLLEKQGNLTTAEGIEYIAQLTNVIPSSANYQHYVDIVKRDSMLRKLILGSADIIDECKTTSDKRSALDLAEKTIFDISNEADTSEVVKLSDVIPDVMTKLDEISKDKSKAHGIRTMFRGIDGLLNGLHKSDLIILAARPAVGKTSFAMNIVENVALQGYSCLVFSLEMSKEQLAQRMLCSVAGVSMERVAKAELNKSDWLKLAKARELLSNSKIFISDSAIITPQELISKCRRIKRKHGLDLVMIDYIQLMTGGAGKKEDNRQQEVATISRNLKILAKEVNVPVLALSQLSRAVESRKGRPQLADLRESGAIEQDADIVMFIHRPDKNATEKELAEGKIAPNVAEILVEKHRSGPTGLVKLYFKGECTKFINLNEDGEPDDDEGRTMPRETRPDFKGYEDLPEPPPEQEDATGVEEIFSNVDSDIF